MERRDMKLPLTLWWLTILSKVDISKYTKIVYILQNVQVWQDVSLSRLNFVLIKSKEVEEKV